MDSTTREDGHRTSPVPPPGGSPAQDWVDLVSVNLHAGYDPRGAPFDLAAACLRLTADIVVTQEAWRTDGEPDHLATWARDRGAELLRADLRDDCDLQSMRIAPRRIRGIWGLALATTLPVLAYEVSYFGRSPGDPTNRAAQIVTLGLPGGRRLRIANAHLTHRFTSPVQLMRLVLRLARTSVPTVIAGDLNMPGVFTGLAVGYRAAVDGRTYPAPRPFVQLDHILVGRGITSSDGSVLADLGSDHLPITARLQVR